MTVAVAPLESPRVDGELRLCRSALLYADTVTLISPKVSLLQTMAGYRQTRDIEYMRLAAKAAPTYAPEYTDMLREKVAEIDATSRADRRAQRKEIQQIFDWFRPVKDLLASNAQKSLADFKYDELELAIDAGFLVVEPMESVDIDTFGAQRRSQSEITPFEYIGRVTRTLTSGESYPLFDQVTGDLVRKAVQAGILAPVPTARRRGRDAALANGFFDSLQHFKHATIDEILDIRTELRKPLGSFRQGVQDISKDIDLAPEDPEFAYAIEDAWSSKVAPALDEIEELISENSSYRDLFQRAINDPAALVGMTGLTGMFVAAGPASGLPATAAAMLTGAATSLGIPLAAVRAMLAQWKELEDTKKAQFYFLYASESRFARLGDV
ncbi:hypothetical protein ACFWPH_06710 [Nocardia sp. NPDC058499]|uniref:hypothetical protein n=1 Tax=Nocardia sp. NPDC058499 TaxID=3346530 RepID=UPI00366150B5